MAITIERGYPSYIIFRAYPNHELWARYHLPSANPFNDWESDFIYLGRNEGEAARAIAEQIHPLPVKDLIIRTSQTPTEIRLKSPELELIAERIRNALPNIKVHLG